MVPARPKPRVHKEPLLQEPCHSGPGALLTQGWCRVCAARGVLAAVVAGVVGGVSLELGNPPVKDTWFDQRAGEGEHLVALLSQPVKCLRTPGTAVVVVVVVAALAWSVEEPLWHGKWQLVVQRPASERELEEAAGAVLKVRGNQSPAAERDFQFLVWCRLAGSPTPLLMSVCSSSSSSSGGSSSGGGSSSRGSGREAHAQGRRSA